ncbi:MAG: methyltransferase FkbM family [Phenylobacterium sp.]|nr:methyltransferase FkbM family [Phenylobacterium sp.]
MQDHADAFRRAFHDRYVRALFGGRFPDNSDARRGIVANGSISVSRAAETLRFVEDHRSELGALWADLSDDRSRETLLFHYLNRGVGNFCSRAPHVDAPFLEEFRGVERFRTSAPKRPSPHQWLAAPVYLEEYQLPVNGYAVTLETNDVSAVEVFRLNQYRFQGAEEICVEPGEVVIDGGACWGDTALYFAAEAKGDVRVLAFELSQSNIDILNANLARNPDLGKTVEVIRAALGETPGAPLYVIDKGAASRVSTTDNGGDRLASVTLDQLVRDRGLERVDFIKLDVEGAERMVLEGAAETIRRFRPKFAVSVYHRPDDPFVLHRQIRSYGGDYSFYLKGVSMNYGETVLFAKPR